ncbi:MAG: hypothetical protein N1989_09780, partial [Escherichia coli]
KRRVIAGGMFERSQRFCGGRVPQLHGAITPTVDGGQCLAVGREPHIPDLSASRVGTGRELFSALREKLSGAEQGATCITF